MNHFYKHYFLGFILLIFTLLSSSCAGLFIHRTEKFKDKGSFEVSSVPSGADVVLNGKVVGKTPMKVALGGGLHLLSEKKDNTLVVYKEGYRKQNFVLKPSDEKTKYFRKGLGWIGFGELLGGLALSIAGFSIHEPNTNEQSLTGMGVSGLGFITFLSGLADMHTAKGMRPSSKRIRTYGNDVYVTLESNADYERKIAEEKKEKEDRALRIEKERLEYERQVAAAIVERERKAAIEKEERERQAEIARVERERQAEIERKRTIERIEKERERARQEIKNLKIGDMICAKNADCLRGDECLIVRAYVENYNKENNKYQLRISGSSNNTLNGKPYKEVDNVDYFMGDIIWLDLEERPGTIWVKCVQK